MLKWILLALLSLNLFALEISMDSAKDDFTRYSTLHLTDTKDFVCQEMKDDFLATTEIICAFSKKPLQKIDTLQNDFFKVNSFLKKDTFFISIKPFYKIKLIPSIFNLVEDNTIYSANITKSKHWNIIGYKDKLPLINNRKRGELSINFPFFLDKDTMPYVGSLDIKGNPVHIQKVGDVKDYLKIKKYYNEKKFDLCMSTLEDVLAEYPNTLFKAELLYYKIKLYAKLDDFDNVIDISKIYLREYSANENIPEVLALIAQAYSKIGMNSDADYFFDRLFSQHPKSKFTYLAYIFKGEMLESSGGESKAIKFYKKALFNTKDLDIAAHAAYNLANARLVSSLKDSAKYVDKIVKAKPSYFKKKYKNSKIIMHSFADENDYLTASKIASALLDSIGPTHDDYEKLLSENGLWLAKSQEKKRALIALNKYLKQFPDGDFLNEVEIAKDALFFDTDDSNVTEKLAEYDLLIEQYDKDTIGQRAIYEKAKLMLSEKMYDELLSFKDSLLSIDSEKYSDTDVMIQDAAVGVMKNALDTNECKKVLTVSHDYNITLSDKWDDGVYRCAMKGGEYLLGKNICQKNIKSKNLEFRKKWLYRYIKVDFATGNYSEVIEASKDLISLIEDDKESPYKDIYRYIFDTYDRLEKKQEMIKSMAKIEDVFGLDYLDIERYVAVMSIGSESKDDNMVIKYGSKVMSIQKDSNSSAQSPYVEFALYQAYLTREDYNKALEVIKHLDDVTLDATTRARQKYLLGSVLNKLWRDDEAKRAYSEAIKADPDSAWAKLAKSANEL